MRIVAMVMAAAGLLGPGAGWGQEPPAETRRLDPVVVTATKIETPQERLGATVSVITEEEIQLFNYDRIEDALRQVPGVDVQRSGAPGKNTTIRIRGAGSQQVQVLVDGMRVKSPTLGAADLAELALDAVDRIEIVRGPQSTLYGADAIGGVVNIITRKGRGPTRGSVWLEGGSYATFREQANVQGAYGGFNFNLGASRLDTAGTLEHDDSAQTSVVGRIGYDFPWPGELSISGRYSYLDLQLPIFSVAPTVLDPNSVNRLETYLVNAAYQHKVRSWWDVRLRLGHWANDSYFENEPPPGPFTEISRIDTRRFETELLNTFQPTGWDTLTVGVEYRSERGRNDTTGSFPTAFSKRLDTVSLFAQNEVRILDRLFLGGGVRYEASDTYENALTGRASAALVIRETGSKLRFAWGQGFRAPTINDLFYPGFGNPELQPEHSTGWEVGVDQRLWRERVRLGATYFSTRYRNLIEFVFDPTDFSFIPHNVGRARTQGVELSAEADLRDWLTVHANYTYTDSEDLTTGKELRRVPRHAYNAGVTLTPMERLSLFAQAHVVSSQFEGQFAGRNPGYYRIDAGGTFRLLGRVRALDRLDLTLRVQNLTDQQYHEVLGFPAPGFNAMAGLRAYFR